MAVPLELSDRESLIKSASTSLNSKVVSQYSTLLAPLAVDSVLSVVDPAKPDMVDLRDIKIVKKLGGTVDDTELVKGLVFDKKASHAAGGPTRMENAKIAVIQFQISPPKTDIEQSIVVSDYTQMDRILKEERNYILGMIKKIKASGYNVLLIQKSILRDAVTDLSRHYLAKAKIMVIKDVERDDIEFITKTLNCLLIANIEHFRAEKLGHADLVEEVSLGDGKIVKVTGIKDMGKTTTVLILSTVVVSATSAAMTSASPTAPVLSRSAPACARRLPMPALPEHQEFDAWYAAQTWQASTSRSDQAASAPAPQAPKHHASHSDPTKTKRPRPSTSSASRIPLIPKAGMSSANNSSAETARQSRREK
ncbi:hypothetical protein V6N13_034458 [Hibiscus sabdariffa]|uniref:Uncharacterized protein n=2 Tax=Hibiscus sabdariffa TaxID=183260 RepID=A0ABR2AKI2_9ROSI